MYVFGGLKRDKGCHEEPLYESEMPDPGGSKDPRSVKTFDPVLMTKTIDPLVDPALRLVNTRLAAVVLTEANRQFGKVGDTVSVPPLLGLAEQAAGSLIFCVCPKQPDVNAHMHMHTHTQRERERT
jgi:hypothetical protein